MLFHSWEYFLYFLLKEDQHSIHSPFFFKLYQNLKVFLRDNRRGNPEIEQQRNTFLASQEHIKRIDFGAGSRWGNGQTQQVGSIAKKATTPVKFSLLYQFLCMSTPAHTVMDLGTSLGINTSYLASVTNGYLYSFEGDPTLGLFAKSHLNRFEQVKIITGNLDETLGFILQNIEHVDFVLIDANHRYLPTMDYFKKIAPKLHENSIVVIADIHWSKEMSRAWNEIKDMPSVSSSIDFFECGVLFFNAQGVNNDYILSI
ncbi:class I SAM-dependent methyltransferase [uncultured Cyclobacterium sp.]|uniref:O-methyltransferase n=1 Tax=uncultured Cyclobacterium sp. TaxID=453820 RepID=UPI0030EF0EF4|tara:strand:- start:62884 stop:63657 length:774 start_codon:yes stop_codon:yes gene_type:complete